MFAPDPRLIALRDALSGQVLRGNTSYHLRERIGEGGQGWVFKANWDEPSGLVVIVKVLRPDAVNNEALQRFEREAEVLRLLSQGRPNPHIVRFFDHAVARVKSPLSADLISLPFTVLEYVNGPTLEHVLKTVRGRGLPVERVRRLVRQVVLALDVVHAQKVVHRDLKPSNILLANEAGTEIAKVTDFGLVKVVDVNLQRTTSLAGASLGYAPPEQYEQGNQRVSVRTDVFSLAAITFEMLSGGVAFPYKEGENPLLIVTRILNGQRPSLFRAIDGLAPELAARRDLIEALDAQLSQALAADPNDRQASVQDWWQAIEPLLRAVNEPRTPGTAPRTDSRSRTPYPNAALPFAKTEHGPPQGSAERRPLTGAPPATPPRRSSSTSMNAARHSGAPISRVRASDSAAANPAAWSWSVASPPVQATSVRAAVFEANGESIVSVGANGLARFARGAWAPVDAPSGMDVREVRGLRRLPGGDLLLFGAHSLAVRLSAKGAHDAWGIPDRDITFHGACTEENGVTTLVGERPGRGSNRPQSTNTVGAVAQFVGDRLSLVSEATACSRLRGTTRLRGGTYLACGDWGSLVRLELGVAELVGSVCGGHLLSIEATEDGGAVTVGVGGHALSISPRLEAHLEAVQTTRDLHALTIADDGAAWAGAAQARLLRRTNGAWVRMSGDVGIAPAIVAVWATARFVRAICDDGAIIEGRLA
ncbi:MAG: protein kinase domain-containing protein [Polyangiaceae bacterium]